MNRKPWAYRTRKVILRSAPSLAALALLTFAIPAFAQDEAAQPADAAGLDTIVVTATCRGDALPGVPIAISAVSSESTRFAGAIDGS
jgi:hypothetical protein